MGALSSSAIVERIASGSLVISPVLKSNQIGLSSVDLRMGTVALISRAGSISHVNPASYLDRSPHGHDHHQALQQKHERYDVPYSKSLLLHPGHLVLVPTLEWVSIPADLQGVVTARSSWAREGLSIATATIVNPGYRGIITLELANLGQVPISLAPGLRLAQIAFYEMTKGTGPDPQVDSGQFSMSFEPSAGNIAKGDETFLEGLKAV